MLGPPLVYCLIYNALKRGTLNLVFFKEKLFFIIYQIFFLSSYRRAFEYGDTPAAPTTGSIDFENLKVETF